MRRSTKYPARFLRITSEETSDTRLSVFARFLYVLLSQVQEQDARVELNMPTLMMVTRRSECTVLRDLRELRSFGYIGEVYTDGGKRYVRLKRGLPSGGWETPEETSEASHAVAPAAPPPSAPTTAPPDSMTALVKLTRVATTTGNVPLYRVEAGA